MRQAWLRPKGPARIPSPAAEQGAPKVHRPRRERDLQRMRRAAEAVRAAGGAPQPALAAALAQISAAFAEAAVINDYKVRVERLMLLGPDHAAVCARFGPRALMLRGRDLAAATLTVERRWRDERRALQIASAFGRGTRRSLEVLGELRLILRLMRSKRMHAAYEAMRAALHDTPATPTE
jgi:hypothetical protein